MNLDRDTALEKVQRVNKNTGRVRYDSRLPHLPNILSRNWRVMIETYNQLKKAYHALPMSGLKRGRNLQDKLVRKRLPPGLGRLMLVWVRPGFRC